uniref:Reverse transcriptase Ty1/copia-type domain-containing protein n=1 Tax=Cannabis sativa TaxID=3483 RepID=A0A803QHJ1_CANSA
MNRNHRSRHSYLTADSKSNFNIPPGFGRGRSVWNPYAIPPRGGSFSPPPPSATGRGTNPNPSMPATSNNTSSRPICQLCSKPGHLVARCYQRFNMEFPGIGAANMDHLTTNIATSETVSDPSWYPDSGATSHCTANESVCTQREPYYGHEEIHMGDGVGLSIQHDQHSKAVLMEGHLDCGLYVIPSSQLQQQTPIPLLIMTDMIPTMSPPNIPPTNNPTHNTQPSASSSSNTPQPMSVTSNVSTTFVGNVPLVGHDESPPPSSNSPAVPTVTILVSAHNMVTRAKPGISKARILLATSTPTSYKAIMQNSKWLNAMNFEMAALVRNKTWVLVPLPKGRTPIGCKWLFKKKYNSDGSIDKHKARVVAQGFLQQYGFDYSDTFSLVVKPQTIRIILTIVVTHNCSPHAIAALTQVTQQLYAKFALKELKPLTYFLGIQVKYTTQGGEKLSSQGSDSVQEPQFYSSTVGALQYATITSPEISYAINKVSQFMHTPLEAHWNTVKKILRYLAGSLDFGLHIKPTSTLYTVYNWKQETVCRSSTEAQYRSLAHTVAEISRIQALITEIGLQLQTAPTIWCENRSSVLIAANPILHSRTKHIELDL